METKAEETSRADRWEAEAKKRREALLEKCPAVRRLAERYPEYWTCSNFHAFENLFLQLGEEREVVHLAIPVGWIGGIMELLSREEYEVRYISNAGHTVTIVARPAKMTGSEGLNREILLLRSAIRRAIADWQKHYDDYLGVAPDILDSALKGEVYE